MSEELIPILHVKDAHKTSEWYKRLGFEVESEHRFAPSLPLYLFLRRGHLRIHLSEHRGDARPGTLVYFYVNDLDEVAQELDRRTSRVIFSHPYSDNLLLSEGG